MLVHLFSSLVRHIYSILVLHRVFCMPPPMHRGKPGPSWQRAPGVLKKEDACRFYNIRFTITRVAGVLYESKTLTLMNVIIHDGGNVHTHGGIKHPQFLPYLFMHAHIFAANQEVQKGSLGVVLRRSKT